MPESILLGTQVFWMPYAAGSADAAVRGGTYEPIGYVAEDGIRETPQVTVLQQWAPSPGGLRRVDARVTQFASDFEVPMQQMNRLTWSVLFGSQLMVAGGNRVFTPGAQPTHRGWIKGQSYGDDGTLRVIVERFVLMTVDSTNFSPKAWTGVTLKCQEIYSSLASGEIKSLV